MCSGALAMKISKCDSLSHIYFLLYHSRSQSEAYFGAAEAVFAAFCIEFFTKCFRWCKNAPKAFIDWFFSPRYNKYSIIVAEVIPLPSRILAVADVYDAMTKNRVYHRVISRKGCVAGN